MPDRPTAVSTDPERDEAAGYRPISGLAVAALLLAGVTAVTIVFVGLLIWRGGRPILSPGVFGFGRLRIDLVARGPLARTPRPRFAHRFRSGPDGIVGEHPFAGRI